MKILITFENEAEMRAAQHIHAEIMDNINQDKVSQISQDNVSISLEIDNFEHGDYNL